MTECLDVRTVGFVVVHCCCQERETRLPCILLGPQCPLKEPIVKVKCNMSFWGILFQFHFTEVATYVSQVDVP